VDGAQAALDNSCLAQAFVYSQFFGAKQANMAPDDGNSAMKVLVFRLLLKVCNRHR